MPALYKWLSSGEYTPKQVEEDGGDDELSRAVAQLEQ